MKKLLGWGSKIVRNDREYIGGEGALNVRKHLGGGSTWSNYRHLLCVNIEHNYYSILQPPVNPLLPLL